VFLPNAFGTAPGLHVIAPSDGPHGQSDVLALPGPPGELQPMFERDIRPRLRPPAGRTVLTRLAHIVGIAEADCVTRLGDLTKRDRTPLVGITASGGILTLRMRYEGQATPPEAQRLVDAVQAQAAVVLGDHLFATGPGPGVQHLASTLIGLLKHRRQTLAVVESCTGGLLGETLTEISGASAAFAGGFITYANELKIALGVDATALATHGAVSEVVASQMAARARERTGSHYALSITGIAGPDGGTEAKPVGTVHIGLATAASANVEQAVHTRRFLFTGDRVDIRRRAAVTALAMLYFHLQGHAPDHPRLLWETTPRTESASMAPSS
jgi:nicotinamide-nucleotide amidase